MEYFVELVGIGDVSVVRFSFWFVYVIVSLFLCDVGSVFVRSCGYGCVGFLVECV